MLGYDPEVSQSHLRANAKTGSPVWASDIYRKVTLVSLWWTKKRKQWKKESGDQSGELLTFTRFTHTLTQFQFLSEPLNELLSWDSGIVSCNIRMWPMRCQTQRDLQGALQTCSQETGCSEKNSGRMFFSVWLKLQVSLCVCAAFFSLREKFMWP